MATLKYKAGLLRGLLNGQKAFRGPAWVTLDITRRCNNICLGCSFHPIEPGEKPCGDHQVDDLSPDLAQKLSVELFELNTSEIVLSGEGEPFLHPGLFEIVEFFKKAGLRVQLFTNGTLIDRPAAEKIVQSGLDVLDVSVWAVNIEEHTKCHPGMNPDYLDRRLHGLELISEIKRGSGLGFPRINLQLPLNQTNFANIGERVKLILSSGCEEATFGFFRDWGGRFENRCLLPEDDRFLRNNLVSARESLNEAGVHHNIDEYLDRIQYGPDAWRNFPCYAGWFESYIKVDGTVFACCPCPFVLGNLSKQSFADIWNGVAYRDFRRRSVNPNKYVSNLYYF